MQYKPEAVLASAIVVVMLLAFGTLTAFAANPSPTGTGQPSQSCQTVNGGTNQPGNAGATTNTGSPFSPNGHAGGVYANNAGSPPPGSNTGAQHSSQTTATSQYDVSCAQNQSH